MTDTLELVRLGAESNFAHLNVEGVRSWLIAGNLALPCIERGNGYKWLRAGDHDCEFGWWTSGKGVQSRAIRILGYGNGRIYFHPANVPGELAGCMALGLAINPTGVTHSRSAFLKLFDHLGGWTVGKKLALKVYGTGGRPK